MAAGAYVLAAADDAVITLVGTGSEVSVCLAAAAELAADGFAATVVSMPSWELFEQMPSEYRASVIREDIPSLAVEAGSSMGWHRWVDDVVSIDRFGSSAPGDVVMFEYGINPTNVEARARELIET